MELTIYDKTGKEKKTVSPDASSQWVHEVGVENVVTVNFTTWEFFVSTVGDYIMVDGRRFSIKKEYRPKQASKQKYTYNLKFYGREHDTEDILFCRLNQGEDDLESVFAYDGTPMDFLLKVVQNMNRNTDGVVWKVGEAIDVARQNINFNGLYCWDALAEIAKTFETEWWMDGEYLNLSKCEHGEAVPLGYLQGLKSGLTQQENTNAIKWFTRLIPVGSSKNIDPRKYGYPRLQLPSRAKSIDLNTQLGLKEHREEAAFTEIFPHRTGTISAVRSEVKTNEETGEYTVYYIKDKDLPFNPDDYMLPEQVIHIVFQSGYLMNKDFEVNWHNDTQEFEIINIYPDEDSQLPGGNLIPATGNTYILYNLRMPDEYYPIAERQYELAVNDFLSEYSKDISIYSADTDYIYVDKNSVPLSLGQRVKLVSDEYFDEGFRDSRITRVTRKLNNLSEAAIECSNAVGTSWKGAVDSSLNGMKYTIAEQLKQGLIKILRTGDTEAPSEYNVFSALRSLATFLRKDIAESVKYLMTFLGGILVKKFIKIGDFITGVSGGYLDENGDAELRSLYLRDHLSVPEVRLNYMTYFDGYNVISPGGGFLIRDVIDNGDGTYTVYPEYEENEPCGIFLDDINTGYWHNFDKNSSDILGAGKVQFRVISVDYVAKTAVLSPKPGTNAVPAVNMRLGQTGNFTNKERQTYIIIDSRDGNCCITFFDHANTWDPEPAQMKSWFGKKKGMKVAGIDCDNYSAVLQNIIMTGLIFQVDEISGSTVRVPIDFPSWEPGRKYAYYSRVPHNGSTWLCVNDKGTTSEPSLTNPDWLVSAAKGEKGDPGISVVGGGHWESSKTPYEANTMVSLANCVFLSKVKTSNPPIKIARFKNGNFRKKKDGGYILAGKSLDWQLHEDWDLLLDGRELKGTSITFLGSFATAPANPAEGNSYYNTVDKCTYIYQNGAWMVMVSDGKDGKGYEWIYTRTNIIGLAPDKPDSKQQDDYVPEGWTDDFLGVDQDHQVEWACKRTKKDGVWSEFSTPAVVHRWSKDGESNVMADLDNEMVSVALTSAGITTAAQSWTTNVSMWYGTEKLTLDTLTVNTPTGFTASKSIATGAVAISIAAGKSVPEQNTVTITLASTKNGQIYTRELTFKITGVRGGADGAAAVIYSLVTSVTSVKKDKNGNYSVASVSCKRMKTVGAVTTATTDGELKYSRDGAAEVSIGDNIGVSSGNFTKSLKFVFYVGGQVVDIETIPMLFDGGDGADGDSIVSGGSWESAKTPYQKNRVVSFAGGSYLSKVETSNPPIAIARFKNGSYRRKKDGRYILAGRSANRSVNADWQEMVAPIDPSASYWLDCPVSTVNFTSTGTPSPSAFLVTCKQNVGGNVSTCNTLYLAARKFNGSWLAHVGATQSSQISVPATAGYTQFAVRAYKSASDANSWNDNYVAEKGIGVAKDGTDGQKGDTGATGAFPRDRQIWQSGQTYVWNPSYRDKVIHPFNGIYYNFLVRNFGASVTAAPTSANGDTNWEAMDKLKNIATDTVFADGANIAGFMFAKRSGENAGIMKSPVTKDGKPVLSIDGQKGALIGYDITAFGKIGAPFCKIASASSVDFNTYFNYIVNPISGRQISISLPDYIEYDGIDSCFIIDISSYGSLVLTGRIYARGYQITKLTLTRGVVQLKSTNAGIYIDGSNHSQWHVLNSSDFEFTAGTGGTFSLTNI